MKSVYSLIQSPNLHKLDAVSISKEILDFYTAKQVLKASCIKQSHVFKCLFSGLIEGK